jgi:O-antigen/teichoic acid export membrane protein
MQIAQAFVDSGFPNALIQKKNTTFTDECSVFYFNIVIAVVIYLALYLLAPLIASFYSEPILARVLRVISLTLVIGSFAQIQQTLLTKQIDFESHLKVNLSSIIVSGIVGVVMAYRGYGVWALVAQQLTQVTMRTATLWLVSSWQPGSVFCLNSLRSLFKYGSKLLFSGLLDAFYVNVYGLIIGRVFSPADLGFYNRGCSVPNLFMTSVSGAVSSVMFPVFSTLQDDHVRLKAAAKRALTTTCIVVLPLMFGLSAVAEPFIRLLLTEKWLPCAPYLRIMCFVYATWPVHVVNLQIITAIGRSDVFMKLEIIKKVIVTIAIIVTFKFGVYAMVVGQLVTAIAGIFINTYYTGKLIKYTAFEQLKDLMPLTTLAAIMAFTEYLAGLLKISNLYLQFSVQVMTGLAIYITACVFMKIDSFYEVLEIVKKRKPKL